ncbi:MAG: histidine kinase [Paludibacteraceae bacterium]|nr:histidine kinase [Paludibacteraceae bacterium]
MEKNIKHHRRMTALSVVGLAVGYVMVIALNNIFYEHTISLSFMVYCTAAGAPFIILGGLFVKWMARFFNRLRWTNKHTRTTFAIEMAICIVMAITLTTIGFFFFDPNDNDGLSELIKRQYYLITLPPVSIIGMLMLFVAKYDDQVDLVKEQEEQLEQAQLRLTQMRYQQLKAQINPHFLFNSLNILSSLINIDTKRAVKYTKELAAIYRYLLAHDEDNISTLKEELEFCRQYANILMIRYNQGLVVKFPDTKDADVNQMKVMPTAIQLLIENACKHSIVSEEKPLEITITIQDNYVVVSNNVIPRIQPADSTGMGLRGLSDKYNIVAHKQVIIEQGSERFTVKVPLLTQDETNEFLW